MEQFIRDLCNSNNLIDFCRAKYFSAVPFVFSGNNYQYYNFRKRIADKFNVDFSEVHIMGSASLGFSPYKQTPFDYNSDVDVSIVSETLFNTVMDVIFDFQMHKRYNFRALTEHQIKNYHDFLEYVALGWIRPDKFPVTLEIGEFKRDWFDFFSSISYGKCEIGNYKVNAGIFRNRQCLEKYTILSLEKLKRSANINRQLELQNDSNNT